MHVHRAVTIDTVRQHAETAHTLSVRCPRCDRRTDVDLEALIARGLGDVSVCELRARFRCRDCGARAELFRHPPVPPFVPPGPRAVASAAGQH